VIIAIIGTGRVGQAIAGRVAGPGHTVRFGSRNPAGDIEARPGVTLPVAGIPDAIAEADIVVVAIPAGAVEAFLAENGPGLSGRLVIDAANRSMGDGPANSAALFAAHAPAARYARAFNHIGWEVMAEPQIGGQPADFFFSSAEADRGVVEELIEATGARPVYVGEGRADLLDGLLQLWAALAYGQKRGRHLGFKVLTD
jgi:predicted dinucleotide-binding enzyme